MFRTLFVLVVCTLGLSATTAAQQAASNYKVSAKVQERISETHLKFTGGVEFEQGDTTLFADEVEFFTDQDRAMDVNILEANLLNEPQDFSATPKYGYRWRNIANPKVYFDENTSRLMINYRSAFIRLAL